MSDETTAVCKMVVEGEITNKHIEENEDIEVLKVKIKDIKEFVSSHNMSIKGALMLLSLVK